jgi:outer membrane protein assembly factor BamB
LLGGFAAAGGQHYGPVVRRTLLLLLAGGIVAAALVAAYLVYEQRRPHDVVGSRAIEFRPELEPGARPRAQPVLQKLPWPTYGADLERTHFGAGFRLRPPFRRIWKVFADWSFIEFPPVIGYGRLYVGTNRGRVLAIDARTGRVAWRRELGRCIAASPTLGAGVVYVALMSPAPCTHPDRQAAGMLVALNARTGRVLWRFRSGVIESSPLLVGGLVLFGSWDHRVYAVDVRTHRAGWTFETGGEVKGGVAFAGGTVYAGSYDGRVYALAARSGRLRWSAAAQQGLRGRGRFYATPAVAYGRVYVGATDGLVYAFGARSGRLLWARRTGSYVYGAAAVWRGGVYVGSYDHRFYRLDAATGRVRWSFDAGHAITGAPTVLDGLVYFATCGSCLAAEADARARRTFALDARSGRLVWTFPDGEYSPLVADSRRAYLTGFTNVYALAPAR